MKKGIIIFLVLVCQALVVEAQDSEKPGPLEIFTPFIGTWYAPDSIIAKNPQMKDRGIFRFEMDMRNLYVRVTEDFSLNDKEDYSFTALVVKDVLTSNFEFVGVNKRHFFFKGQYKDISETGFTREYDVSYPMDSEMAKNYGQVLRFREVFRIKSSDVMAFDIKYYNKISMKWEPWSPQEFVIIRK